MKPIPRHVSGLKMFKMHYQTIQKKKLRGRIRIFYRCTMYIHSLKRINFPLYAADFSQISIKAMKISESSRSENDLVKEIKIEYHCLWEFSNHSLFRVCMPIFIGRSYNQINFIHYEININRPVQLLYIILEGEGIIVSDEQMNRNSYSTTITCTI